MKRYLIGLKALGWALILGSAGAAAFGQAGARSRTFDAGTFGTQILSTIVFGFIGIFITIVGFKMFDAVIKFDMAEEICEKQNIAVAILSAAMIIAIGMIVAVAVY